MQTTLRSLFLAAVLLVPGIGMAQSNAITRADFVVNMMASKGLYGQGAHCFPDVTNQAFAPAVCEARSRGYVTGYADGKFRPFQHVTLIDAAVMAMRLEGVSLPGDTIWYRPALEKLGEWNAIPRSIGAINQPLSISQANEILVAVRNRGNNDDDDDDRDDDADHDDDDDDLTVSITESDPEVDAGDLVTYRIRIVNDDNDDIEVDVRAELDRDMIFVSASDDGEEDDDVVEWDDVEIDDDDDVTLQLTVRIRSNADDTVKLRVEVEDEVDEETTDVDDDDHDDDDDDDEDIDLSVDDSGDPVRAGGTVTYRIRLRNDGNDDEEIDVRAELDDDMDFVAATEDGDEDDGVVEWDDVEIEEDDTTTLLLTVRMDGGLDDGDTVRLRVRAGDLSETEETRIDRDDDDHDEDVEVSITDVQDPVEEGEVVTYRIQIRNNENNPVRISARAFLDDETSFVSASDGGDLEGDDEVEWRNVDIARDATKTLLLSVRPRSTVDDGDTVTLRVEVEDDEDTETTRIEEGDDDDDSDDIRLTITDSRDPAEPGDTVIYRIRIENRDDDDAEVDVRALLDADMQFVSASHGGERSGDVVRWYDVDVDGDDDVTVTLTVRVRSSADDGDTVRLEVEAGDEEDVETTRIED